MLETSIFVAKTPKPPRPRATPDEMAERKRLHESRVEYVADLMRELKYRSGVTAKALEREWNLPRIAVCEITTAASRRVRAELTDPDRVMSKVSASLDWVLDNAIESGDRHALIKAAQVWAQVTGAGAAAKVQVQQDLTALTPEALKARKAEIIER